MIVEWERKTFSTTAFVSTFNINIHSHSNNPFRNNKFSHLFSLLFPIQKKILMLLLLCFKREERRRLACLLISKSHSFSMFRNTYLSGCEMKNEFYWRKYFPFIVIYTFYCALNSHSFPLVSCKYLEKHFGNENLMKMMEWVDTMKYFLTLHRNVTKKMGNKKK